MPKLHMIIRKKEEAYGLTRHESYSAVIPYEIVNNLALDKEKKLHASVSQKTQTLRLHKKHRKDMTPIQIRQRLTKTYKNQRYYSTAITIPIKFIRQLELAKGDELDITESNQSIVMKRHKQNSSKS